MVTQTWGHAEADSACHPRQHSLAETDISQPLLLTFLFLTSTRPSWGSFLAQGAQCVAVLLPGFP